MLNSTKKKKKKKKKERRKGEKEPHLILSVSGSNKHCLL